jgi:hypothetical protein
MVGKLIAQHTTKLDQTSIHDAPLFKIKGGGPALPGQSGKLLDSRLHSGGRQCCPGSAGEYLGRSRGVRRKSHLSKRATMRAQKRPCITS